MRDFFYGIQDLFVNHLFAPFDYLRKLQLDTWFGANVMSWIFLVTFAGLFIYWMRQLSLFDPEH